MARGRLIAALDIGTSKVCCFVAHIADDGVRITGIGQKAAKGMRAGTIIDMDSVEESIRSAVDAAERMAGETVQEVLVNLTGGQPASHIVGVEVAINGHPIDDTDLARVMNHARARQEPGDRSVVHGIPIGYRIDGSHGIKDPRGMFGDRLGVDMHIITSAVATLRNLAVCVERCHLQISDIVVSPMAAGLACLVEDELDLGVTLVDMGGGTTKIAVFYDGNLIHSDAVEVGGTHVTNDIARGLSTPVAHAERLKTLYGSAVPSPSDEGEFIAVPQVGEAEADNAGQIPRSLLVGIIKPRLEETFELVRDRLTSSGVDRLAGRRVVLTGGASQLQALPDLAARVLDKKVRIGRPIRVQGLADATAGPAFSACAGLLLYAQRDRAGEIIQEVETEIPQQGRFARIGRWLRENF